MYGFLFIDLGINLDLINMAYVSSYNSGVQIWPLIEIKMAVVIQSVLGRLGALQLLSHIIISSRLGGLPWLRGFKMMLVSPETKRKVVDMATFILCLP